MVRTDDVVQVLDHVLIDRFGISDLAAEEVVMGLVG
jgi:hypothetical protein